MLENNLHEYFPNELFNKPTFPIDTIIETVEHNHLVVADNSDRVANNSKIICPLSITGVSCAFDQLGPVVQNLA